MLMISFSFNGIGKKYAGSQKIDPRITKVVPVGFVGEGVMANGRNFSREPDHDRDHNR
jgi:hypothetical protein